MGQFMITTTASDKQEVYNYLVNESPDFSIYAYREWTPEDNAYVTNVLATITNYANTGSYGQNVNMAVNNVQAPSQIAMPTMQNVAPTQPAFMTPQMPSQAVQQMPAMPQMNANVQASVAPMEVSSAPQIVGIDLPDVGMSMPQMPSQPTPVAVGMGLEEMYNSL
jgi:hypothetical protein